MFSIPETLKHEHSAEIPSIIISMHTVSKLHTEISDHLKLAKYTWTFIIHYHAR